MLLLFGMAASWTTLLVGDIGEVAIANHRATIPKQLNVQHPAR